MPPPPPPAPAAISSSGPAPSALLKSIEKGARLKKTVTNDRSQPIVEAPKTAPVVSNPGGKRSPPSSRDPPMGGMFAGGMPKLRSTGSKLPGVSNDEAKDKEPFRPALKPTPAPISPSPNNLRPTPRPPVPSAPTLMSAPMPVPMPAPATSFPMPVPGRQAPPPPSNSKNTQPFARQPPPVPSRSSENSPRNSTTELNPYETRWTFKMDIPIPRPFPESTKKGPPLPPSRGSTNVKRPPAPPPPTR